MAQKSNQTFMKTWDPWKTYDLSVEEVQARRERAQMRLMNKKKFQKLVTDPYQFGKGHIFDPAVQRWVAMKACEYDYFKATPKTAILGMTVVIAPIVFMSWLMFKTHGNQETLIRSGGIKYKDREFKFHAS